MYVLAGLYNPPADPEQFTKHYLSKHIHLATALPDISHYALHWVEGDAPFFMAALMYWSSKDLAMAAFGGPAGTAAMEDLPNFAAAGSTIIMGEVETPDGLSPTVDGPAELHSAIAVYDASSPDISSWWSINGAAAAVGVCHADAGPDGGPPAWPVLVASEWQSSAIRDPAIGTWGVSPGAGFGAPGTSVRITPCRATVVI